MDWSLDSWQSYPVSQQPRYEDQAALNNVLSQIKSWPPLVARAEINSLRNRLVRVEQGDEFLFQCGDCAERFEDCRPEVIINKLKLILQMGLVVKIQNALPVVFVSRMAGQYAKPRSKLLVEENGQWMSNFQGDIVNSFKPDPESRKPQAGRLLAAYQYAAMTLNFMRTHLRDGASTLEHIKNWDLSQFSSCDNYKKYQKLVKNIIDQVPEEKDLKSSHQLSDDFYVSHEGLLLNYEQAHTRHWQKDDGHYNHSAHMLWIGDRTRKLDEAHVEFFRGVKNPLGIKLGPGKDPKELAPLIQRLNPSNDSGKIVLITRLGCNHVKTHLPLLINEVKKYDLNVSWLVDPMHGNTRQSSLKLKTRAIEDIKAEIKQTFEIHEQQESILGGVHLELTGENVTECIGGDTGLSELDLAKRYESYCDPRLNYSQSLDIAFFVSDCISRYLKKLS